MGNKHRNLAERRAHPLGRVGHERGYYIVGPLARLAESVCRVAGLSLHSLRTEGRYPRIVSARYCVGVLAAEFYPGVAASCVDDALGRGEGSTNFYRKNHPRLLIKSRAYGVLLNQCRNTFQREQEARAPGADLREFLEMGAIPEPNSGCLLWLGELNADGYGRAIWGGRRELTHRLAWEAHNGPIPKDALIWHDCDVRSCINPLHVYDGTHADNMRDMYERDRARPPRGEAHCRTHLTDQDIRDIRNDSRSGTQIGADYGISKHHASRIRRGEQWKHVQ